MALAANTIQEKVEVDQVRDTIYTLFEYVEQGKPMTNVLRDACNDVFNILNGIVEFRREP